MNKRKVSLEDFYKWYSLNKEELLTPIIHPKSKNHPESLP
ncbi:putative endonuclease [Streptococcus pneumoniae]|nr:putative endonuclease [Streptococcus pneumoniae]VNY77601.1 putative endonuclease [Streptococcus pneumoniae]